jgi:hypothetical protein
MGGEQGTRMPTINISDIRKARGIRGDRLYDSDTLWKSMDIAPAP